MRDSRQLLAEYARNGSEAAFRELVNRYLDLVYSVALRRVDGDADRAQDVAQTVFTDLAGSLSKDVMLGGWLHRHTCFVAANVMRQMNLGQNMASESSGAALTNQLVGMAIEKLALNAMYPNSVYGDNGPTVQDNLEQLAQERADIKALGQDASPLMQNLSDQDMLNFDNRRMMFGEVAAMQWVVGKHGNQ
jgi:DNA-directed RNA polymerase specialized sigma24 family protein